MKIKLYVAVLSRGWLRAEMLNVLDLMRRTEGVEIILRDPRSSWAVPVSNNRNIIRRDFLKSDCDFLLMIDHDVVPLFNPAEFVFADKDIIGMPAKIQQTGNILNWSAYIKHPNQNVYSPIDFARVDPKIDLLWLNQPPNKGAVGTGCILIKRKVLEQCPPFGEIVDENGIVLVGEDFNFCEQADKLGFEIYTTPNKRCEHFHETGLYGFLNYEDCDGFYQRRKDLSGKKCIIGITLAQHEGQILADFLNSQGNIHCTYGAYRWSWQFDEFNFMLWFPKLFYRNNFGKIPADVAPWYLSYVDYMITNLRLDIKIICLEPDLDIILRNDCNIDLFDRECFPKYNLPKKQALKKYCSDYSIMISEIEKKYPDKVKIFKFENLSSIKMIDSMFNV